MYRTRIMWRSLSVIVMLASLCLIVPGNPAPACTIGVVAGEGTPDGRPLLWKNRDTSEINNAVSYFEAQPGIGGFIAVVTSTSSPTTKVWAGVNDAGFAINNALVSDFPSGNNGVFMKQALEQCRTVDDFEKLVRGWTSGQVSANFGVIDAHGGAAMFEVKALTGLPVVYARVDAVELEDHFVVMANENRFSSGHSGDARKLRAIELFQAASAAGNLDHEYILRVVARDLDGQGPPVNPWTEWETDEFINRWMTRSVSVVHGVRPIESPIFTTFWTILGEPVFGVAVPLFSFAQMVPEEMTAFPGQVAPMITLVTSREVPIPYDNNTSDTSIKPYMLWYDIPQGPKAVHGYSLPLEDYAFKLTRDQLDIWRRANCVWYPEDFQEFIDPVSQNVYQFYSAEKPGPWKQRKVYCSDTSDQLAPSAP